MPLSNPVPAALASGASGVGNGRQRKIRPGHGHGTGVPSSSRHNTGTTPRAVALTFLRDGPPSRVLQCSGGTTRSGPHLNGCAGGRGGFLCTGGLP